MSEEPKPASPAPPPNQASPWIIVIIAGALLVAGFAAVRQARLSRSPDPVEPALKFDDAQYRKTDPSLIAWQETQSFETGFEQPRGIALSADGKQLYVAGDQQVRAFRADGCREKLFQVGGDAYCVAVAPDGRLIVGLKDRIEIWSTDGQRAAQWESLGPKAHLTGVTARGDSVWAGDAGNRVVLQFDSTGKITGRFGEKGSSGDQLGLVMPSPHLDVAIDAQGTVWLNNPGRHRLEAYAENGALMRTWGTPTPEIKGFCGCCNPTDFAFLPDGRFVTSEKGIPRIKVSSADGAFQNVVAGAESFDGDNIGLDLAVAPDGRIFVLDPLRKTVRVFAPKDLPQRTQSELRPQPKDDCHEKTQNAQKGFRSVPSVLLRGDLKSSRQDTICTFSSTERTAYERRGEAIKHSVHLQANTNCPFTAGLPLSPDSLSLVSALPHAGGRAICGPLPRWGEGVANMPYAGGFNHAR